MNDKYINIRCKDCAYARVCTAKQHKRCFYYRSLLHPDNSKLRDMPDEQLKTALNQEVELVKYKAQIKLGTSLIILVSVVAIWFCLAAHNPTVQADIHQFIQKVQQSIKVFWFRLRRWLQVTMVFEVLPLVALWMVVRVFRTIAMIVKTSTHKETQSND